MTPYIAQLVFQVNRQEELHLDQQWHLIHADDDRQAWEHARRLGSAEEETFTDRQGRSIEWKFMGVADLQIVHRDGRTILHTATTETETAAQRSRYLEQKCLTLQESLEAAWQDTP